MRRSPFTRSVAIAVLVSLLSACATTHVPPISTAGAAFKPEKDERALWDQAREEEKKLRGKAALHQDPLLVDYLETIVGRLESEGMAAAPGIGYSVTVIEDPTFNAFAYPHGSLYVHTGLLARMENEDQLATVLGHEMTHVENRHMLRQQRSAQNKAIGLSIAAIAASLVLAGEQGEEYREGHYGKAARIGVFGDLLLGLGLQLAFVAAVNGYGRELEREADLGGFEKLRASGYDLSQTPKVYQALLDDRGEQPSKAEVFFFGSHPQLTDRITAAKEWNAVAGVTPAPRDAARDEEFRRRLRPVLKVDARMNLEMGRLQLAQDEAERALEMLPSDPEPHVLIGRIALARGETSKDPQARAAARAEARDAFREAVRLEPDLPAAHREIGLMAYADGDRVEACMAFRQYLELDPTAADAAQVRDYVRELTADGSCR